MFDLMGEIARNKDKHLEPRLVNSVKLVQNHAPREFSFGAELVAPGNRPNNDNQKTKSVTNNHQQLPRQKQPESQDTKNLSPLSPMSPQLHGRFGFLREPPFTEEMIYEGLKCWLQPFDQDDLNEIATGELPIDKAREYLFLWARQHRNKYQELKSKYKKGVIP